MKPSLRVITFGIGCFTAGFLTCYLLLSQPPSAPAPARPATTTAPVGTGTGLAITGIVTPTNLVIRGPDRWQWADGSVHETPPELGQQNLDLIETRPQTVPDNKDLK
jgi:hypothetical protein